ncbi:MAG TPA: hypothetical protein VFV38_07080 [Ktedonobacteraceae bacterium]|nr:hypothetical protein [Ktedonobacteraceae bacterium]
MQFSTERGNKQLECQVRHMLGRVSSQMGDFAASNSCSMESLILAVSVGSETMTLNTCTALADLHLAEEKPEEAWRSCEMALEDRLTVQLDSFVGMMYLVCGKVAEALAKDPEKQEQIQKAVSYHEMLRGGKTGSEILSEAYRPIVRVCKRIKEAARNGCQKRADPGELSGRITATMFGWERGEGEPRRPGFSCPGEESADGSFRSSGMTTVPLRINARSWLSSAAHDASCAWMAGIEGKGVSSNGFPCSFAGWHGAVGDRRCGVYSAGSDPDRGKVAQAEAAPPCRTAPADRTGPAQVFSRVALLLAPVPCVWTARRSPGPFLWGLWLLFGDFLCAGAQAGGCHHCSGE